MFSKANPLFEGLTRRKKSVLVLATDCALVIISIYIAIALRRGLFWAPITLTEALPYMVIMPLVAFLVSRYLGVPRIVLQAIDLSSLKSLMFLSIGVSLVMLVIRLGLQIPLPRSVPGIFCVVYFSLMLLARMTFLVLRRYYKDRVATRKNVLIYGAGSAGRQLQAALNDSVEYRVVGFVDDNPTWHELTMGGVGIYGPADLERVRKKRNVTDVIIAIPSASRARRAAIGADLERQNWEIMTLPSIEVLLDSPNIESQIRPVKSIDLLGRQAVRIDVPEATAAYGGKIILISGAGGSIGSELCRQVLTKKPTKLILLDVSEFALYSIEKELTESNANSDVVIEAALGSVCDKRFLSDLFDKHKVEVVLHAAAYKHVPLVEKNELSGIQNNVVGTQVFAEVAVGKNVERFILVSSDKAVRPTNVMGATKRFSEMVVQELQSRSDTTIFSMVRFGNVLGSSGSVFPLFREQINRGGPITVTHPEVTRFFMTIAEAAQLVLIAGAIADGGEVFVLDMGESVKIVDLARNLVRLAGLTVRDEDNPDGDIEIKFTGLRPGEKLYEELLIGEDVIETPHPKILVARENYLKHNELTQAMNALTEAIETSATDKARDTLKTAIEEYKEPEHHLEPAE